MERKIFMPDWIIRGLCFKLTEGKTVYQTEGLSKHGLMEIEVNFPFSEKQAMEFINIIGIEMVNGKRFKDGDIDDTIFSAKIAFREVDDISHKGKRILRVIFQDKNFKFPWEEGCEEPFKSQIGEDKVIH